MDMTFGMIGIKAESAKWDERVKARLQPKYAAALHWLTPSVDMLLGLVSVPNPLWALQVHQADGLTVLFSGQLFNHDELVAKHAPETPDITSAALIAQLYRSHGMAFTEALIGRYWLMLWDSAAQAFTYTHTPFLPQGFFYTFDNGILRFSNYFPVLRVLIDKSLEINPRKVAQYLIDDASEADISFYQGVRRLLTGQQLIVRCGELTLVKVWTPERILTPISYSKREDYIDAFRELFTRAVGRCIPQTGVVASELSGGLDSSSVSAVAADLMKSSGRRLQSFGGVPPLGFEFPVRKNWNLDDRDLMKAVAEHSGNIDLHLVDTTEQVLPLNHLAQFAHDYCDGPIRNTGNINWMGNMYQQAHQLGAGVVLNGHMGNMTISWAGGLDQRPYYRLRRLAGKMKRYCQGLGPSNSGHGLPYSVIRKEAIEHYDLSSQVTSLRNACVSSQLNAILKCTYSNARILSLLTALQLYFGIVMMDPTVDLEVIDFCLQVPSNIYCHQGRSRLLIRESMTGYLPDTIRWNTRRGEQDAAWFGVLKALTPVYLERVTQWRKRPLLDELLDFSEVTRLLQVLPDCDLKYTPLRSITADFCIKLPRALHVCEWMSRQEISPST